MGPVSSSIGREEGGGRPGSGGGVNGGDGGPKYRCDVVWFKDQLRDSNAS